MSNSENFRVESITPERARQMLAIPSLRQRKSQESTIRKYERDMARGAWVIRVWEPIRVSGKTGAVEDGVHRLTAVSRQPDGFSLDFIVVEIESTDNVVLDTGVTRSVKHALEIEGFKNAKYLAQFLRTAFRFALSNSSGSLSRAEQVDWLRQNDHAIKAGQFMASRDEGKIRYARIPFGALGALFDMALYSGNVDKLREFVEIVEEDYASYPDTMYHRLAVTLNTSTKVGGHSSDAKQNAVAAAFAKHLQGKDGNLSYSEQAPSRVPGYKEWRDNNFS